MSRSLKFARMISAELRYASVDAVRKNHYIVKGRLDTGVTIVPIVVTISWLFRQLKTEPPKVCCLESWMKTGPEWHNGPPLCWVLREEWHDAMSWKTKPVQAILDEGRDWLLRNTCCLINRHYTAHLDGLTAWPPEWKYWDHFDQGVKQYEREKRLQCQRASR